MPYPPTSLASLLWSLHRAGADEGVAGLGRHDEAEALIFSSKDGESVLLLEGQFRVLLTKVCSW